MRGINLILKALNFAALKHKYQRRKGDEHLPYINHPIKVAFIISEVGKIDDPIIIASAILHDVIEDTETTSDEIEKEFGNNIASIVEELTDNQNFEKQKRKKIQIKNAPFLSKEATIIRIADKIENIEDITISPPIGWSYERKEEYLEWAEKVVRACKNVNSELKDYFFEKLKKAKTELQKNHN